MEGLSVEEEMKEFRNRAIALYESVNENFRTLTDSDVKPITSEQAHEEYCDLWEEAFEEILRFIVVEHEKEFLEIMKDVRVDIERIST